MGTGEQEGIAGVPVVGRDACERLPRIEAGVNKAIERLEDPVKASVGGIVRVRARGRRLLQVRMRWAWTRAAAVAMTKTKTKTRRRSSLEAFL